MTSPSLLVSSSTSCQGRAGISTSLSVGTFSTFQENSNRRLASYPRVLWQDVRSWIREIISITINSSYPTLCFPFLSQDPQDLPTIYSLCPDVTCWWDPPGPAAHDLSRPLHPRTSQATWHCDLALHYLSGGQEDRSSRSWEGHLLSCILFPGISILLCHW